MFNRPDFRPTTPSEILLQERIELHADRRPERVRIFAVSCADTFAPPSEMKDDLLEAALAVDEDPERARQAHIDWRGPIQVAMHVVLGQRDHRPSYARILSAYYAASGHVAGAAIGAALFQRLACVWEGADRERFAAAQVRSLEDFIRSSAPYTPSTERRPPGHAQPSGNGDVEGQRPPEEGGTIDGLDPNARDALRAAAAHAARLAMGEAANFYGAPVWWVDRMGGRRGSACYEFTISRIGGKMLPDKMQELRTEIGELRRILDRRGIAGDGPEAVIADEFNRKNAIDPLKPEAEEARRLALRALTHGGEFAIQISDPETGTRFAYAIAKRQVDSLVVELGRLLDERARLTRLLHAADLGLRLRLSVRRSGP